MKHCPKKFRPLVADLLDGKITPSGKDLLLTELRKNPKFADELAQLYGDHLVLTIQNQPDRTDDVMNEVYSVTRWAGETRETKRTIEETQDGMGRIIEETVSVTRWMGQSAQFIRNVEDAVLPRHLDRERRKSWRRILYGSAVAAFAALTIVAILKTNSPQVHHLPVLKVAADSDAKVIRGGFTYAITADLAPQPADVYQTADAPLHLGFPDGSILELARNSEIRLPERNANNDTSTLSRGSATVTIPPRKIDAVPFVIQSVDARITVAGEAEFVFANRNNGTLLRVSQGKAHVALLDAANSRGVTVDAGYETVTKGSTAFALRRSSAIDDAWILELKPVLWLDAATWETLDLDSRRRVASWHDRSSSGTTFVAPGKDSRPRILNNELNDLNAVYFAAPDQILTGIRNVRAATIIAVCRFQGVIPQHGGLFGTLGDFGVRHTGKRQWYGQSGTTSNDGDFGRASIAATWVNGDPAGDAGSGIAHVVSVVRQQPAEFPKPTLGSYFRHPGYGLGSRPFHGIICEVIVFERPLDEETRQRLEKHLASKWDLPR